MMCTLLRVRRCHASIWLLCACMACVVELCVFGMSLKILCYLFWTAIKHYTLILHVMTKVVYNQPKAYD